MISDFFYPQPGGVESHIYQLSTVSRRPHNSPSSQVYMMFKRYFQQFSYLTLGKSISAYFCLINLSVSPFSMTRRFIYPAS